MGPRSAPSLRLEIVLLLAVLTAGAALRIAPTSYGLPRHDLGQDERITLMRVRYGPLSARMATPAYNWPQLGVHLSRWVIDQVHALQRADGRARGGRTHAMRIGRITYAVLGTAALLLVYLCGRLLFDPAVGLAAAAVLALTPIHVFRSWLWVPDGPMTTAYTLALLAGILLARRPTWPRFLLGGFAVGLAAAFKYNGALACLPLIVGAVVGGWDRERPRALLRPLAWLAAAGALSVATFVAADPALLHRLDELRHGFAWVSDIYSAEVTAGPLGFWIARYLLFAFARPGPEGIGPVFLVAATSGGILMLRRHRSAALLALLPAVLYFLTYTAFLDHGFERMFLPLVAHAALAAGYALVLSARVLRRRLSPPLLGRIGAGAMVAVVLAVGGLPGVRAAVAPRRGDTRLQAVAWMLDHLPAGAVVRREWSMIDPDAGRFLINQKVVSLSGLAETPRRLARRTEYVVATSASWEWALGQRSRPGFEREAAFYDGLLNGEDFELEKAFRPGWEAFGPEVRILRSRAPRGPRLAPSARSLALTASARVPTGDRKEQRAAGRFRIDRPWRWVAGPVRIATAGTYRLTGRMHSPEPVTVRLRLGDAVRTVELRGSEPVAVTARLPAGTAWWEFGVASPRLAAVVELTEPTLHRLDAAPRRQLAATDPDHAS